MKNRFYTLGATFRSQWYWGRVLTNLNGVRAQRMGMRGYSDAVEVEIVEGQEAGDFLWNGCGLLLCSPRVLDIWAEYRAFETYRVKVVCFNDLEYTGVAFTGRGGPFDPVRSRPKYAKTESQTCRPAILDMDGLFFDESQWDGSDLFHIDEFPCVSILTARVADAMKTAQVTNCQYIPLEDYGNVRKLAARAKGHVGQKHSDS